MRLVAINIDGHSIQVPSGTTILEAAESVDIHIPTLCHFDDVAPTGFCRVCVVEVDGQSKLLPACTLHAKDGMVIKTRTPNVVASRRMSVEMLVAQHPMHCLTCYRNGKCDLQTLARQFGLQDSRFFTHAPDTGAEDAPLLPIDDHGPAIVHDPNMCILCGLCIEACRTMQGVDVIDFAGRGYRRTVECAFGQSLGDVECTSCGQCIQLCPTQSYYEKNDLAVVREALQDEAAFVVALLAPTVGVSIGEEFEQNSGMALNQNIVASLKAIGFDRVFDTAVGADVVILEESYELLTRVKAGKRLPMFSSSSPAMVKYMEHFYPNRLGLLSSCKSPAQALASLIKSYYAKEANLQPENVFIVSLTPCTAEKFERTRPEMVSEGHTVVDACLTTKELATLLKGTVGDAMLSMPPEPYDAPFHAASGAGIIWGAAGGMAEGVMRTFYELFTKKKLAALEFENLREPKRFHDIHLKMGQETIRLAILHGTGQIPELMESLASGSKTYHYIDIKGCPLGCLRGGGEPLPCTTEDVLARGRALYELDQRQEVRKAHESQVVKQLYDQFLKKPASKTAQKFIHTKFIQRQRFL